MLCALHRKNISICSCTFESLSLRFALASTASGVADWSTTLQICSCCTKIYSSCSDKSPVGTPVLQEHVPNTNSHGYSSDKGVQRNVFQLLQVTPRQTKDQNTWIGPNPRLLCLPSPMLEYSVDCGILHGTAAAGLFRKGRGQRSSLGFSFEKGFRLLPVAAVVVLAHLSLNSAIIFL